MAQINKPSDYFNILTYTGDGSNPRTLTGAGFQPDWTWLKNRTDANGHTLADAVRGANKTLSSDGTGAEVTDKSDGHLDAFTSDGFTVGAGTDDARVNNSGSNYVAWNWLASNTTASNTDGSITSTVSANTTSGFSIVSYTGTGSASDSVGHGLSQTPGTIFVKRRDSSTDWRVWHQNLSATTGKSLRLNTTDAEDSNISFFYSQPPNSTTFRPGDGSHTNASSGTYIAYCFAEKKGFSKMGSYVGNGSTDGTFIYTGFKPAWIMRKDTTQVNEWTLIDSTRSPFNQTNETLVPNASDVEDGDFDIDILSNGFKCRTSESAHNQSGVNYIYMAFAESPLVGTNNIPATAR